MTTKFIFCGNIERSIEMENIIKIFNSQDETEIKEAFKEIIKEQFKSQIEEMDLYLFDSNEIEDMIKEAFEEIINEVKKEYKEKIKDKMFEAINKKVDKVSK
jgi:Glu-tRNA(Gln) amidotransferase subunit E-like FAD-binding protein